MLRGITEKGEMKNIKVSEDGKILIQIEGTENSNSTIVNEESNPIPAKIVEDIGVIQTSDKEVVLNASVLTLSTEAQTISVNKKVTGISIANYSETADISMTIGEKTYQIGANLAVDLPINAVLGAISLTSTEADTKIQLVVKGVE